MNSLTDSDASVQIHLQIMQAVISRMAANSASTKAWCIALVSALLVLTADGKGAGHLPVSLSIVPIVLFCSLDIYYLGMERRLRATYNEFIRRLHSGELTIEDLYAVGPSRFSLATAFEAASSFSVWAFYVGLSSVVLMALYGLT